MNIYGTATPTSTKTLTLLTSPQLPRDLQESIATSIRNSFVFGPSLQTRCASNSFTSLVEDSNYADYTIL